MQRMNRRGRERGLAAVETAILLPLVVLIVMAVFEYGWLIIKSEQIAGAAREGARTGARYNTSVADATNAAEAVLTQVGLTCAHSVDVSMGVNPGDPVTVTITLPYDGSCSLTHFPLLPVPPSLVRQHTFAKEGPPD